MGFECPPRQTTPDFLTSLTNPAERLIRSGFEGKTPSSPDEFAAAWMRSEYHASLLHEIDVFNKEFPVGGPGLENFKKYRSTVQAKSQYVTSTFHVN
jgi:ATP-binding cassette, subfamily G (WHITE), member 2, PDR